MAQTKRFKYYNDLPVSPPQMRGETICIQRIPPRPGSTKEVPFEKIDKIKIALSKYMQNQYSEYKEAFSSKNLKSYKTYNTQCGIFYAIRAVDFSDSRASGYCGSAGCDNFFFKKTTNGIKLVFHVYLEGIEDRALDLNGENCLVLKVWVHGLKSKNLQRAGQDWLDGQIQFKKNKVELILNDP